jgi:protocatechuate 3,4-dioxygenase beta subunit
MMKANLLSRRELLLKSAAMGSLTLIPSLSLDEVLRVWEQSEKHPLKPTPWNEIGPFYKRDAPQVAQLQRPGDPGLPVQISGKVLDTRGDLLEGAKIEIWQANHVGVYDIDGYSYRATLTAGNDGKYEFGSVMPGHYPGRVCQHIHYLVSAPGHKPLITQLYFATDPVFEGDPKRNYLRDPLILDSELVRPVLLTGDPKELHAAVNFELVVERL